MANNTTVSTSTSVQYSGPSYYGDGPTLPHLVGFTLAIVSLAIALGFLRVLLLSCRSRRLAQREAAMRLGYDVEGGGPPAVPLARVGAQADPPKKEQPRVMVVQPDEGICCGLQLGDGGSAQEASDSQRAARLVDEASANAHRRPEDA